MVFRDLISKIISTRPHEVNTAVIGFPRHVPWTTKFKRGPESTCFPFLLLEEICIAGALLEHEPNTLSLARASRTLDEPMKLLRAALKVAVRIPSVTNGGQMLIGSM